MSALAILGALGVLIVIAGVIALARLIREDERTTVRRTDDALDWRNPHPTDDQNVRE